jgi:hypothetical protein
MAMQASISIVSFRIVVPSLCIVHGVIAVHAI